MPPIEDRMNDFKPTFNKLRGVDIEDLLKLFPDLDAKDLKKLKERVQEYLEKHKSRKLSIDFLKNLNIQDVLNDD